jgi:hypothetical protein
MQIQIQPKTDTGPKIMDPGKEAENIRNPCGSKSRYQTL